MATNQVHSSPGTKSDSNNEADDQDCSRVGIETENTASSPVPAARDEGSDSDFSTTDDETSDSDDNGIEPMTIKFTPRVNRVASAKQIRNCIANEDDWANYDYSKEVTGAGNLEWEMRVCKEMYRYNKGCIEALEVGVKCLNFCRQWTADAFVKLKIIDGNGDSLTKSFKHVFRCDKNLLEADLGAWTRFTKPENGFVDENGRFNLEATIAFRSLDGVILPKKNNFSAPSRMSDVILVVKGRKLHVSSQILGMASPVFEQLFFDNCSSTDKPEFTVKKVSYKEFVVFLNHLYSPNTPITVGSVQSILSLANRFSTEAVTDKAERFLLGSNDFSLEQNLLMADKHSLVNLKHRCLSKLDTMDKIKKIVPSEEYQKVSADMKIEVLERVAMK